MEKMNLLKPFKILMTADTVGGIWTYALQLSRALDIHGVHVYLATMGAPLSAEQRAEIASLTNITLYESGFKVEWMENAWENVQAAGEWLVQLAYAIEPDIIHINGYAHGNLPWPAPVVVVAHDCACSRWEAIKDEPAPAMWNIYQKNAKAGLGTAHAVVAPSESMLSSLNKKYGQFINQRVIYHGCYTEKYNVAIKEPFVVSAGSVANEAKNLMALWQVAPSLPWPVHIAGEHTGIDLPISANGMDSVRWLGQLSRKEVKTWLSRAAIFALPARYEPFGYSILEAALSGCALILGDIPNLREIWQDTALFVSPNDTKALQKAIEYLIDNNIVRMNMATRARQRAFSFTASRMAAQYMDLYTQVSRKESRLLAFSQAS